MSCVRVSSLHSNLLSSKCLTKSEDGQSFEPVMAKELDFSDGASCILRKLGDSHEPKHVFQVMLVLQKKLLAMIRSSCDD